MGLVITVVLGMLALLAILALGNLIGKSSMRSRTRTTWLCAALAFSTGVGAAMLSYATGYYVMPVGWIAALTAAGAVIAGLVVRIGMDVCWRPSRLLALVGFIIASGMAYPSRRGSPRLLPVWYWNSAALR